MGRGARKEEKEWYFSTVTKEKKKRWVTDNGKTLQVQQSLNRTPSEMFTQGHKKSVHGARKVSRERKTVFYKVWICREKTRVWTLVGEEAPRKITVYHNFFVIYPWSIRVETTDGNENPGKSVISFIYKNFGTQVV